MAAIVEAYAIDRNTIVRQRWEELLPSRGWGNFPTIISALEIGDVRKHMDSGKAYLADRLLLAGTRLRQPFYRCSCRDLGTQCGRPGSIRAKVGKVGWPVRVAFKTDEMGERHFWYVCGTL